MFYQSVYIFRISTQTLEDVFVTVLRSRAFLDIAMAFATLLMFLQLSVQHPSPGF